MRRRKFIITSITTIFACGIIIGVFGLSGWFGRSGAGFSSALLPEWKYRRSITLSGQTSNLTDYQVKVELPASLTSSLVTAGKLQSVASNFADIRFTDANDNKLLNFWIETATTTATSTIWVKVPGLSASKSSTINMYYGNPSATSASNGANTFEFFDDFNRADSATVGNNWVETEGGAVPGTCSIESNQLKLYASPSGESWAYVTRDFTYLGLSSFAYEADINIATAGFSGGGNCRGGLTFKDGDDSKDYMWHYGTVYWSAFWLYYYDGTYHQVETAPAQGIYNKYGITYTLSGGEEARFYFNNVYKAQSTAYANYTNSFKGMIFTLGDGTDYMTLYANNARVRKYASPEPTATVGSEQTQMTPVAHWRFDEGSGAIAYNSLKKVAETNLWTRRRALSISNTGSSAQTNYQVKVELTTSNFDYSAVKTDGSDIRFVDADGTELNYWKETWNTSATSTFWVKVPSLPANTTSTIYMYYSNPSASSASNGANTFDAFYEAGGAGWTTVDPNGRFSQNGRTITFTTLYRTENAYIYKVINVGNFVAEYAFTFTGGNGDGTETAWAGLGLSNSLGAISAWSDDCTYMGFGQDWQSTQALISIGSKKNGIETSASQSTRPTNSVKYWYRLMKNDAAPIAKVQRYTDKFVTLDQEASVSTSVPTDALTYAYPIASPNSGIARYVSGSVEDFRVRKYASPEPTVTAVGSQEFGEGSKWSPDAAWISGASWTTGKFNNALKFDGVDDYVNLGDINF